MANNEKLIIGVVESCQLPDLGIAQLNMRVDTGAKTSSLHVDEIEQFKRGGKPWVRFNIHPTVHKVDDVIRCEAPIKDIRHIKSSNGLIDERYVIETTLQLGQEQWLIDLSLSNRSEMTFLMLLGRKGMGKRVLVDPSKTFLIKDDS
ncbi:MAG: ATP-dependent zinc protease [Reinekea sp.]|jgi:hypothetical protein